MSEEGLPLQHRSVTVAAAQNPPWVQFGRMLWKSDIHTTEEVEGIASRGQQTQEWPMGNITMQCLHAFFETANLPSHQIKAWFAFLSSPFFEKQDICSIKTYEANVKKARTNAVRSYVFFLKFLLLFVCCLSWVFVMSNAFTSFFFF